MKTHQREVPPPGVVPEPGFPRLRFACGFGAGAILVLGFLAQMEPEWPENPVLRAAAACALCLAGGAAVARVTYRSRSACRVVSISMLALTPFALLGATAGILLSPGETISPWALLLLVPGLIGVCGLMACIDPTNKRCQRNAEDH